MLADRPDLLVVQGDTSSALGAALAGFTAGIPVAHVEAGLRTHDPLLPWPEEEYRTAIDAQARLLFAPTETAAAGANASSIIPLWRWKSGRTDRKDHGEMAEENTPLDLNFRQ